MKAVSKAQIVTGLRGFAAMVFTIAASPVLHAQGVSFQTISLGFGVLYTILALAEIPTGAWADIFGTKKSSVFGGVLQFLALVALGYGSTDVFQVLLGFALYGLGSSFVSGALSALMFASAKSEDGEGFNSNRYFSVIEKVAVASYILGSVAVGFLSEWFGRQSFLFAGAFFLLASVFVAIAVRELPVERNNGSLKKEFLSRIAVGISGIRRSIQLKVLLPVRMLHQVETILGILWLPWIRDLGGGDARWFSVLATGSYLLRYAVNHYFSGRPRPHHYIPRVAYALACMALGSLICVFANNVWLALLGVWTMAGARGAFLPAVQAIQHEEFSENVRTTGLSVMNFSTEVMIAMSYFISAPILDRISVSAAWGISAVCFTASVALCLPALKSAQVSANVELGSAELGYLKK